MDISDQANEQPLTTPVFELGDLLKEHAALIEERSGVPERLVRTYELALSGIVNQISQKLALPEVAEASQSLSQQRDADMRSIESLHARRYITDEQFDDELRRVLSSETYRPLIFVEMAQRITGIVVEVTQAVEETEVAVDIAASEMDATDQEAARQKVQVNLTILESVDEVNLKIGTQGRIERLSKRTTLKHRDYSLERRKTLAFMVQNQGREIKIAELMESVGISDGRTSVQVFSWLTSLTFRRSPMFIHNGKRGLSSGYMTNPDMEMHLTEKSFAPKTQPTPGVRRSGRGIITPEAIRHEDLSNTLERGRVPLRESAVFLQVLHDNSDLLDALDIPTPDEKVVISVNEASALDDSKNGITRNSVNAQVIESERLAVARQFRAIFQDDNLFDEFIMQIGQNDPLYPFIEYLIEFDEEHWKQIIEQVLSAKTVSSTTRGNSEGHEGTIPRDIIEIIKLPNGRKFVRTITLDPSHQDKRSFVEDIRTQAKVSDEPESNRPERIRQTPEWEIDMKHNIGICLDRLAADNLVFEGAKRVAVVTAMSSNKSITGRRNIINLTKLDILPYLPSGKKTSEVEIGTKEIVVLSIINQNSNRQIFSDRKRCERALTLIDEAVTSFLAKHPPVPSGK